MRILICDDNPLMVEEIHKYIQLYFKRTDRKCRKWSVLKMENPF